MTCVKGCKHKGVPAQVTDEQREQFPNLGAKQIMFAWRCKNPQLTTAKDIEFYEAADGRCFCGSAIAQVQLTECKGFEK